MKLVRTKISMAELREMSQKMEQPFVKAVVDIEQAIMVVDAMLRADQEELLLEEHESKPKTSGVLTSTQKNTPMKVGLSIQLFLILGLAMKAYILKIPKYEKK